MFGPVVCARVTALKVTGVNQFSCDLNTGSETVSLVTACPNLHQGDLVAYNTKTGAICTLEDLHADQKEFPHCIPDGIFVLHEEGIRNADDIKPIIAPHDHVVEFEITPTGLTASASSAWPGRWPPPTTPLSRSTSRW